MSHHPPRSMVPEFSRPLIVDRVPHAGSTERIAAEAAECAALATRLGVPVIHSLTAEVRATPWRGGGLKLEGTVTADLEQVSVVSLESFRQTLVIAMERYFLPEGRAAGSEEDEADTILDGVVDLGEVAAETLALELDPYPRRPGETFADHVEDDGDADKAASPFAALGVRRQD